MVVAVHFLISPSPLLTPRAANGVVSKRRTRGRVVASKSPTTSMSSVTDFPYLTPAHRDLMVDLVSAVESRLAAQLLPSTVPADVLSFASSNGASHGALDILSGAPGSSVDFLLKSWLHCKVPTGELNIATLSAFLNGSTDAPHLIVEFIQGNPTSLVILMDLVPRKDLIIHTDYLDEFYQRTDLDKQRRKMEALPQVQPYRSPSLFIRSMVSPTAIFVNVDCGSGAEGLSAMEEIMRGAMASVSKDVVGVWLDICAGSRQLQREEAEKHDLIKRDRLIKTKAIEIDLVSNLPVLFGPDVADRIVREIQKAYNV